MNIYVKAIIKVIAYGVPVLLLMFGCFMLLFGYPISYGDLTWMGWILIAAGVSAIIFEIGLAFYLDSRHRRAVAR